MIKFTCSKHIQRQWGKSQKAQIKGIVVLVGLMLISTKAERMSVA